MSGLHPLSLVIFSHLIQLVAYLFFGRTGLYSVFFFILWLFELFMIVWIVYIRYK